MNIQDDMQNNQNFQTEEARAAPFFKIEQVLIKSNLSCFSNREDRMNFIGNVSLITNPTYIGLLLSNAIFLSYVQSSITGKYPCLPVPLQMFMTPTSVQNAYVFCTKKTGSTFNLLRKEDYDEFCKKINDVQETIKMVKFRTAINRFWEFLQIYEWYIQKIDNTFFTLNLEYDKYELKLQKNNEGIIETFNSLPEWCSKANEYLANKFSSQISFDAIIGLISDNDNKHESQKDEKEKKVLAEKNDEEDAEKEDENHEEDYKKVEEEGNDEEDDEEMGEEDDKSFEEENERVVEDNDGDEELLEDDEDTEENDDANTDIIMDENIINNDDRRSNKSGKLDNNQNVLLLGMATADLVSIGYKEDRSQSPPELVECVLRQVNGSTGGKKMETNLGRDTLRVTMVMNHPSVGSVHTVSLANKSDVKYDENHISSNFTDSRRFVQRLKEVGFGADGNKIDCLIMDYYWFQSVRMQ